MSQQQTQNQQGLAINEVHELLGKKEIAIAIMQKEITRLEEEVRNLRAEIAESKMEVVVNE